ncbi:hypothetical protein ABPG72_021861 [Tetrahymena utriculariae]
MDNNPTTVNNDCSYTISDDHQCRRMENFQLTLSQSFCKRQNQYSIETSVFDDKCSMFSKDGKICETPRFGYTFVVPEGAYINADKIMCAIYNSTNKTCDKYYFRFLPVEGQNYSVFFKNFQNFEKIYKCSTSKNIKCQSGYKLTQAQNKIGSMQEGFFDLFCQKDDEFNRCQQYIANYAINAHTGQCQYSTVDNCYIQIIESPLDNFSNCLVCQKGYRIAKDKLIYACKKRQNCYLIGDYPPYDCRLHYQQLHNKQADDCASNYFHDWISCKDNENFYLKRNCCEERKFSKNYPNKSQHPLGDYCTSLTSDRQLWFQDDRDYPLPEFIALLEPLKISSASVLLITSILQPIFNYMLDFLIQFLNFIPQQPTKVQGCLEYSLFSDTCVLCEKGIVLINSNQIPMMQCSQDIQQVPEGCLIFDTKKKLCLKCSDQKPYCQSPKIDKSRKQFYEKCLICEDGYSLNKQFKCVTQLTTGYFSTFALLDYCKSYCFTGFYFQTAITIQNGECVCQSNNENCRQGSDICTQCQKDYQLLNDGTCKYVDTLAKCQKDQENSLNCQQCEKITNACLICNDGYKQNGTLFWICGKACQNRQIGSQGSCDQQIQCESGCLTCAFNNPSFFYLCQNGVQLIDGSCDSTKPKQSMPNEYLTQTKRKVCIKCSNQCSSCSSPTKCNFYHKDTCIDKCPYGWKKSETEEGKCVEVICPYGQYALYDKENNFLKCSDINSDSNLQLYCSSLIAGLSDLAIIERDFYLNNKLEIRIYFSQSNIQKCFTFKLVRSNTIEQELTQQTNENELLIKALVFQKDISLIINVQKQEIKIKLTTQFGLLPFEIKKNFEKVQKFAQIVKFLIQLRYNPPCKQSVKLVKTALQALYQLKLMIDEDIEIVQVASESNYQKSIIEPPEFRITARDSTDEKTKVILDHTFSADQSQTGKILYKFKAPKQTNNSTIRITSKVLEPGKKRLLESDQFIFPCKYKYLFQSFQIQIQEKQFPSTNSTSTSTSNETQNQQNSEDNSTNTQLIVIIVVSIVVGLAIIGILTMIIIRKRNRASKFYDFEVECKKNNTHNNIQVQSKQELKAPQQLYGLQYIN